MISEKNEQIYAFHNAMQEEIKKVNLAIIKVLEADLDKVVAGFDENLKAAEEELAKLTPEGAEDELKQKIEQTFQVDKKTHEVLQKIVSQVEKDQMNLNQAKAKMD